MNLLVFFFFKFNIYDCNFGVNFFIYRLFAGCSLRAVGFTVGGFVFFGVYEQSRYLCETILFVDPVPT